MLNKSTVAISSDQELQVNQTVRVLQAIVTSWFGNVATACLD